MNTNNISSFNRFIKNIRPKNTSFFGSRRFTDSKNKKSYSLNFLVKKLEESHKNELKTSKFNQSSYKELDFALKKIYNLDVASKENLNNRNIFTRISHKVKSAIGRIFYNRSASLLNLERFKNVHPTVDISMSQTETAQNPASENAYSVNLYINKNMTLSLLVQSHNEIQEFPFGIDFQNLEKVAGQKVNSNDALNGVMGHEFFKYVTTNKYSPSKIKLRYHQMIEALKSDLKSQGFNDVNIVYLNNLDTFLSTPSKELTSLDFERFAKPHSRYPVKTSQNQQNTVNDIKDVISSIAERSNELKLDYWLDGETLLGANLEANVLPYSHEGAISFLEKDMQQARTLFKEFVSKNRGAYQLIDNGTTSPFLSLKSRKSDALIRIYFYKELKENQKLQWMNPLEDFVPNKSWQYALAKDEILPLKEVQFNGKTVKVPAKTKQFLLHRYGDIRHTHQLSSDKSEYSPVLGSNNVASQQEILKTLGETAINKVVTMEGPNAQLEPTPTPKSKQERHVKWKEVLFETKKLFDEIGVHWWLDAGTLIGAYRYKVGQIIPWDHDADLSMLQADFELVESVFSASDDELKEKFGISRNDYPILNRKEYELQDWSKVDYVNGKWESRKNYMRLKIHDFDDSLDIYQWFIDPETKEMSWLDAFPFEQDYPWYRHFAEASTMLPLANVNYYDGHMRVPNDTRKFLEDRYGDLKPCKFYDEKNDDYYDDKRHEYNIK